MPLLKQLHVPAEEFHKLKEFDVLKPTWVCVYCKGIFKLRGMYSVRWKPRKEGVCEKCHKRSGGELLKLQKLANRHIGRIENE